MMNYYDQDDYLRHICRRSMSEEEWNEVERKSTFYGCLMYIISAIIIFILLMLCGCTTTKYVPVIEHKTDTVIKTSVQHDSVMLHDSIHIRERGDTVWIERWHTKWQNHLKCDTIYRSRVDSVPMPYPVKQYVEKQLTWWQNTRMHLGELLMGLIGLTGVIWIVRRKLR